MRSKTIIVVIIMILSFSSLSPITFCKENTSFNDIYVNNEVSKDNIRSPSEFEQATELMITWPTLYHLSIEEEPFFIDIVRAAEEAVSVRINVNNFLYKN